jgi:hypothetical protein
MTRHLPHPIRAILCRIAHVLRREDGSQAVEFAISFPFLMWAFLSGFTYYEGYRQSSTNLKAAYTIGDMVSRETTAITDEYIDSLYAMQGLLTRASAQHALRITVVRWDEEDNRYHRDWSVGRGGFLPMTGAQLDALAVSLPVMPDDERVILVETRNTYAPAFNLGLDETVMENFVFTRPRFAPQVVYDP